MIEFYLNSDREVAMRSTSLTLFDIPNHKSHTKAIYFTGKKTRIKKYVSPSLMCYFFACKPILGIFCLIFIFIIYKDNVWLSENRSFSDSIWQI